MSVVGAQAKPELNKCRGAAAHRPHLDMPSEQRDQKQYLNHAVHLSKRKRWHPTTQTRDSHCMGYSALARGCETAHHASTIQCERSTGVQQVSRGAKTYAADSRPHQTLAMIRMLTDKSLTQGVYGCVIMGRARNICLAGCAEASSSHNLESSEKPLA